MYSFEQRKALRRSDGAVVSSLMNLRLTTLNKSPQVRTIGIGTHVFGCQGQFYWLLGFQMVRSWVVLDTVFDRLRYLTPFINQLLANYCEALAFSYSTSPAEN